MYTGSNRPTDVESPMWATVVHLVAVGTAGTTVVLVVVDAIGTLVDAVIACSRSTGSSSNDRSAFQWGSAGAIASAAIGGAMIAVAANLGRKAAVQGMSAAAGNWADSLAAEHKAVLAMCDKMLDTEDNQTGTPNGNGLFSVVITALAV